MSEETKICSKCKKAKGLLEFAKDSSKPSGIRAYCLECGRDYSRKHYENNRKAEITRSARYNKEHKLQHAERSRRSYYNCKKARIKNVLDYEKRMMGESVEFRIKKRLRDRFRKAIKNGYKKGSAVKNLGCPVSYFKEYIENKFQPGMSWDNYGKWEFDHIAPLSSFNLSSEEDIKKVCHFSNFQPLWKIDNILKGNRI